MVDLHRTRVPALLVVAATVLSLGAGCGSDDEAAGPAVQPSAQPSVQPTGQPTAQPTDQPTTAIAAPTDDQFCALFVQFASDQSLHAGEQTPATTEALIRSGLTLAHLPPTAAMTAGVHAGILNLVRQTLDGIVAPADLPVVEGQPDEVAFSTYLNTYCPA